MTNVRTRWTAVAALWFIVSPACGDTTGDGSGASKTTGVGGTGTGGVTPTPTSNGGSAAAISTAGGALSAGGWMVGDGGGPVSWGGFPVQYGGYPNLAGGAWWGQGGAPAGGSSWGESGGSYAELPPNGATCLCLLAESLHGPGGWPLVACSSNNPNDCTLQKAFCGQTCGSTCGEACINTFSSQLFNDAASYSYGSCTVIIRCPLPRT